MSGTSRRIETFRSIYHVVDDNESDRRHCHFSHRIFGNNLIDELVQAKDDDKSLMKHRQRKKDV